MGRVVYKNGMIDDEITDIVIENGKFKDICKTELGGIDLCGNRVYAGLIDIHTHGCMGMDVMDNKAKEMSDFYAQNGVTSWLPTTMTASLDVLNLITDTDVNDTRGANIIGFHLEGPYISEQYKGAQKSDFIQKPDYTEFSKLKNVKMVTVAPEVDGCMEFIKKCDCIVSIGHTSADYETGVSAIKNGAKCLTHTFNAMPPIHHRMPSVIGAAAMENIYVQVICDGLHIHPAVINILYKIFGADRMILISDSMRATGLDDGVYDLGGQQVYVKNNQARLSDGTIAGSTSTLYDCVKNAVKFGIPESEAFKMASETPASLLGVNKGKIKNGYDADFIVLDKENNIAKTIIGGQEFIK